MTTVYYVRHAEPDPRERDDALRGLTARGLEDRKLVTRFLWDRQITSVLSSPYKRAIETLRDFADSRGLPIEVVDGFRERKVEDRWIEDFRSFVKRQWEDFSYKLPGGECLREVQERNILALRSTLIRHAGENIAIGGHGTALATILNYYAPSFGYADFERIKKLMPWVVEFDFDENGRCTAIKPHDLRTAG